MVLHVLPPFHPCPAFCSFHRSIYRKRYLASIKIMLIQDNAAFSKKLLPHLSKNHASRFLYQSLLVSAIEEDNFLLNTTSCSCRKPSGCILFCYSNIWFYTELHFVYFDPFSTSTECLCPKPCYQFSTRGCLRAKKPYGFSFFW